MTERRSRSTSARVATRPRPVVSATLLDNPFPHRGAASRRRAAATRPRPIVSATDLDNSFREAATGGLARRRVFAAMAMRRRSRAALLLCAPAVAVPYFESCGVSRWELGTAGAACATACAAANGTCSDAALSAHAEDAGADVFSLFAELSCDADAEASSAAPFYVPEYRRPRGNALREDDASKSDAASISPHGARTRPRSGLDAAEIGPRPF